MSDAKRVLIALACALTVGCASDSTGPGDDGGPAAMPGMDGPTAVTDVQVYARAMASGNWVWYKFSADTLSPGSNSPHVARLRTRYDANAAMGLDSLGMVEEAVIFPDSSTIVKEVYQNGALALVAVMYKLSADPNSGHGGWLWGEYAAGGRVIHSVTQDDATCHGCHVNGLDHTRMNDSHP